MASTGLRYTIEHKIGKHIMDRINENKDERTEVTMMIPPIPDSKFIDKLPDGLLEGQNIREKEHQDAYEAEVKVYRCLENIKQNYLVIHQLEFTHEQYSAFVGEHLCDRKRCKKGEEKHFCHKERKQVEGECDFVVVGDNFIAVFEVKGLSLNCTDEDKNKFEGCCETALLQRKRIRNLIQSINPSVMIFEFTIFPNISTDEIHVKDETILVKEDLKQIGSIIDACEEFAILSHASNTAKDNLYRCLLGLWCIDQEGKWDTDKSSLTWCIKDIDQKLRRALVTRKSVDTDKLTASSKTGKEKKRKYPENPGMVEAPKLFKDYLNINCLTQGQLDAFNSTERLLWVEGPAGSGKTMVMLGKIINIVQNETPPKRVIVIIPGLKEPTRLKGHLKLLKDITDCTMVSYESYQTGDISSKVAALERSVFDQLCNTTSKVVLFTIFHTLIEDHLTMYGILTNFDYVFVDDYQSLYNKLHREIVQEDSASTSWCQQNVLNVLFCIVKNSAINLWVLCDEGQAVLSHAVVIPSIPANVRCDPKEELPLLKVKHIKDFSINFKKYFSTQVVLPVNLRNTMEICALSSFIRTEINAVFAYSAVCSGQKILELPKQRIGHFLRGPIPEIYLMRDSDPAAIKRLLGKELRKIKGSVNGLDNKDIAVLLFGTTGPSFNDLALRLLLDGVTAISPSLSVSGEWPAVISVHECLFLPSDAVHADWIWYTSLLPSLYIEVTRARVYSTLILCNYIPNRCPFLDRFLSELRKRRDICKIVGE